jgi:hypothetical protein
VPDHNRRLPKNKSRASYVFDNTRSGHRAWTCQQYWSSKVAVSRSQWPRGLRRSFAATRLLRLFLRIPLGAWVSVGCECCVLSDRGLCEELITHPEESYRLWCVVVCDIETSIIRRPWPTGGCRARNKSKNEGCSYSGCVL